MAIITMSTSLVAGKFSWGQKRYDIDESSDASGNVASRLLGPPRWRVGMVSPEKMATAQSAIWQTMLLQLRGKVNHLAVWDLGRPVPLGTMRGTMTMSSTSGAGATTIIVTAGAGQAATTLKQNDWLQIRTGLGSQLVQVMADATANGSGVITLTIEPPLRVQAVASESVTWDKPLAYFKLMSEPNNWSYDAGFGTKSGFSFDLLEQWN